MPHPDPSLGLSQLLCKELPLGKRTGSARLRPQQPAKLRHGGKVGSAHHEPPVLCSFMSQVSRPPCSGAAVPVEVKHTERALALRWNTLAAPNRRRCASRHPCWKQEDSSHWL